MPATKTKTKKIFVLDTSVIIYNHNAINTFEEHDVAIPITVFEELDNFKKGNDTKNFEAREFIRFMDRISGKYTMKNWRRLNGPTKGRFKVLMNEKSKLDACDVFGADKPDHRILNAALKLSEDNPGSKVILVSKDVNLRLKAKSLNLQAEDYETGKVKDVDSLYTGKTTLENIPPEVIDKLYSEGFCSLEEIGHKPAVANHYFILKSEKNSALGFYNPITARIERIEKHAISRIMPRNAEQVFAFHALLNPEIKLVTIQGIAGTGKTLLALAAALEQRRSFKQVYLARPIVPLSNKDIGFLPGDIKSKLNPYMEPLWDNLKFIQNQYGEEDKEYKRITEAVEKEKLVITLYYYEELTQKEIAEILEVSEGRISQLHSQALAKLKMKIGKSH